MCCCECCSVTQRKIWVFGLGTLFAALGITLIIIWPNVSLNIMHNSLILKPGTDGYESWVEAPIPIYLEFHLFNWTNPEEIRNPNVKPNFVEMGPYVYLEKHKKENITFHDNYTVTYYERRTWFFQEHLSNGTQEDMVTAAHVITATVADEMRHKNKIIKKVINFMLNREGGELYVTKPAHEWIFDGYQDRLIDFLKLFNSSKIDIPYTRFGWLADRNKSLEYDGSFTIHTGEDDISKLGRLTHWNLKEETGFYKYPCGLVNGSTGDAFPPHLDPKQEITIFATDACRYMNLQPNGTMERHGVQGIKWVGTVETLDSGENYKSQECFCDPKFVTPEECPKTGVVECKVCRDQAPIYASFPHFYLADPSYRNAITGMNPDPEKHAFVISLEPFTGIPLEALGRLQINMMIEPDSDYDIYRGVPKFLMPMFWFEQKAQLDTKLAKKAKLAINLGDYGKYFAIGLICLGGIMILIGIFLTVTKRWKRTPNEDESMLTQ